MFNYDFLFNFFTILKTFRCQFAPSEKNLLLTSFQEHRSTHKRDEQYCSITYTFFITFIRQHTS